MDMTDLHDRLRAAVEERKRVAEAASGDHRGATPTGEHWQWECTTCDTVIHITPVTILDEILECPNDHGTPALRSAEQYPASIGGTLSHFVVYAAEEVRPADALYLALNDPARILRDCARDLRVLERHHPADSGTICGYCCAIWPCPDRADLAEEYGVEIGQREDSG
jgi:hypothetical protein